MTRPLAVTMGEPAGIGGEITLKAWLNRSQGIPPFYVIDDPDRLASLARRLDWPAMVRAIDSPDQAVDVFDEALPVVPILAGSAVVRLWKVKLPPHCWHSWSS